MIKYLTIIMTFTTLCTANVDKESWKEIHGDGTLTTQEKETAKSTLKNLKTA